MVLISGCSLKKSIPAHMQQKINNLSFIGSLDLSNEFKFAGTLVGGLSGIDYDPETSDFFLISDDRSEYNFARFYVVNMDICSKGINAVRFKKCLPLPVIAATVPDGESIRFDARRKSLVWSSEGDRKIDGDKSIIIQPTIERMSLSGNYLENLSMPDITKMTAANFGARRNKVVEGLSYSQNFSYLFACMENSLFQDGDEDGPVRLFKYEAGSNRLIDQYAYIPDKETGVSEILTINNDEIIFVERSWSEIKGFGIKFYIGNLSEATSINDLPSLLGRKFIPINKRLLTDLSTLPVPIDNIEGITFGPILKNGKRTLICVSDNNFSGKQKTQFLMFEIQ